MPAEVSSEVRWAVQIMAPLVETGETTIAKIAEVIRAAVAEEREGLRVFVKEAAVGVRRDPHGQGWCEALDLIEEWIRRRGTP